MPPARITVRDAVAAVSAIDPVMAELVAEHGPPQLGGRRTGETRFEQLAEAICYQQLAGKAAEAIWTRTRATVDGPFTPEAVLDAGYDALRAAGLVGLQGGLDARPGGEDRVGAGTARPHRSAAGRRGRGRARRRSRASGRGRRRCSSSSRCAASTCGRSATTASGSATAVPTGCPRRRRRRSCCPSATASGRTARSPPGTAGGSRARSHPPEPPDSFSR